MYFYKMNLYIFVKYSFIFLNYFFVAPIFCVWIIAKFIWEPLCLRYEREKMPPLPYELKYPFIHDEIIHDNSGAALLNTLILENTPEGLILLRYNQEDNIFEYWTNGRIQYRKFRNGGETICANVSL